VTEQDIFEKTGQAYLCLINPVRQGDLRRAEIAPVVALAPSVPDGLVSAMVVGASWRERLLGLCLAMAKRPETFMDGMLRSLQDLRGISIVPTCAALAVLARRGVFDMARSFPGEFDRAAFDGEVGWAMDKALHLAGVRQESVPGRGPNYGQVFEDHVEVYEWILSGPREGTSKP
jgi:hypothetical protein